MEIGRRKLSLSLAQAFDEWMKAKNEDDEGRPAIIGEKEK